MRSVKAGWSFALALFVALLVAAPSKAAFPGANGKIAFERCGTVECAIWTMNPDGTNLVRLSQPGNRDEEPAFTADGRQLAFSHTPDEGGAGIMLAAPDLSGATLLTSNGGSDGSFSQDSSPAFSPDGKTLVFARNSISTFTMTIWSVSSSGGEPKQLTDEGQTFRFDASPVFSPDGTKIAFAVGSFGSPIGPLGELDIMDADGSNRTAFVPSGSGEPDFTPDGSKLVFTQCCDANHNNKIVVASVSDASTVTPITIPDANHSDSSPAVSPDGTRVAFVRTEVATGKAVIDSVSIDGGDVTTLTGLGTYGGSPAWQSAVPTDTTPAPRDTTPQPRVVPQPAPTVDRKLPAVIRAALARRTIAVKNGVARLTLKCPATAQSRCAGTVTLRAVLKRHGHATSIGQARFLIQPGKNADLKIRLSAAARRALRHGLRLKPVAKLS